VQLARGSSGDSKEAKRDAFLAMLGYELPPYIDEAEAWQPPQDYRLPRYVAVRNRMVGGLVLTVKLHAQAPLAQCTRRFALAAGECYHRGRWRTQARVNRTQALVNRTQARVNRYSGAC
jgi:hypothetical protein